VCGIKKWRQSCRCERKGEKRSDARKIPRAAEGGGRRRKHFGGLSMLLMLTIQGGKKKAGSLSLGCSALTLMTYKGREHILLAASIRRGKGKEGRKGRTPCYSNLVRSTKGDANSDRDGLRKITQEGPDSAAGTRHQAADYDEERKGT